MTEPPASIYIQSHSLLRSLPSLPSVLPVSDWASSLPMAAAAEPTLTNEALSTPVATTKYPVASCMFLMVLFRVVLCDRRPQVADCRKLFTTCRFESDAQALPYRKEGSSQHRLRRKTWRIRTMATIAWSTAGRLPPAAGQRKGPEPERVGRSDTRGNLWVGIE